MSRSNIWDALLKAEVLINKMMMNGERNPEEVLLYLKRIVDDPNFASAEKSKNLDVATGGENKSELENLYCPHCDGENHQIAHENMMPEHYMPEGYPYPKHCPYLVEAAKKQLKIALPLALKAKKYLGCTEKELLELEERIKKF